jgi:hypothetical protein
LLVAAVLLRVEVTLKVAEFPLRVTSDVDTVIVRDEIEIQEGTDVPSDLFNVSVSVAMQLLFDLYEASVQLYAPLSI